MGRFLAPQHIHYSIQKKESQYQMSMFGENLYIAQKQKPFFVYYTILRCGKICGIL